MNLFKFSILIIGLILYPLLLPVLAQPPITSVPTAAQEEEAILKKKPFEDFKAEPEVEIEKEPREELPKIESERKFYIEHIILEGNTILPKRLINELTAEYENSELSLADIIELADKITDLYHSKGYVTSQSYVPPQTIEDSAVIIKVLEGKYGHFYIEGVEHTNENIIKRRLKKKKNEILDYNELRKDLLYLNRSPDRIVKAILMSGEEPETTDLTIKVKDRPPVHIFTGYDNTGSRTTGNWRLTLGLRDTSLLGWDDDFNLKWIRSDTYNLYGWIVGYEIPVNEFGTKLNLSGSYFKSRVGGDFQDYSIESWSGTFSPSMRHPVFDIDYNSGNLEGTLDFGLDLKEARTEILSLMDSRDKLRIIKTGFTLKESDSMGRTVVRNELNLSYSNFLHSMDDGDEHASREGAGGKFIKYNYAFSRINALPLSATLLLNVEGQATNSLLVSSEQYRIGGMYTVRGYAEGDALGDYGNNASVEVRYPLYPIPDDFHIYGFHPRRGIQGTAFVDWGFAHFKDPTTADRHNSNLLGIGFGGRLNFMNCINGRYDIAWPVGDSSTYGRSPRAHMYFSFEEPTLQQYERLLEEMMHTRINDRMAEIKRQVPPDMIRFYKEAEALEKEGKYKAAKELYARVIETRDQIVFESEIEIKAAIEKEKEIQAVFEEAQRYYKEGDFQKARGGYQEVLKLANYYGKERRL